MMREMRTPVFVESKYRIGNLVTCAMTCLRISVIARWADTPSTRESPNAVDAWTTVAAIPRPARSVSWSPRPFGITSSIT